MIQTQTYSQRDKRWSRVRLGFSTRHTLGSDGCIVTSIANMLSALGYKDTPDIVNEKLKKVGAFAGALLIWSRVPKAYPKLRFIKLTNYYNNAEVAYNVYIKRMPVIVKVDGRKIGAPLGHWVLYVGSQKMVDPWFGTVRPTNSYPALKYALYARA